MIIPFWRTKYFVLLKIARVNIVCILQPREVAPGSTGQRCFSLLRLLLQDESVENRRERLPSGIVQTWEVDSDIPPGFGWLNPL